MITVARMAASFQAQSAKYYRVARELRDAGEYTQAAQHQIVAANIANKARVTALGWPKIGDMI